MADCSRREHGTRAGRKYSCPFVFIRGLRYIVVGNGSNTGGDRQR